MGIYSKSRLGFLSIILIITSGFIVYRNSLDGKFIGDDQYLIKNNVYIKKWSNLPEIFTKNIAAGGGKKWNSYRPLQIFSYLPDYSLWKLKVKGYHLTNILLHILVSLSVFWLISILFDDPLLPLLTSLFFIVHPLHTEAVTYISGRADPLAGLFMLLSFIFYIKHLNLRITGLYILSIITYILALLSRENSLILPVIILLYHFTFKKKLFWGRYLPIWGITLIYIIFRVTVFHSLLSNIEYQTSLGQRTPGFFAAIINYLRLIILPLHLHIEHGNKLFYFTNPKVVAGVIIISSLLMYALKERKSNRLIFFALGWFFITLLPQSNLYPLNAYMAEHWLYLPSIGLFLILAKGLISLSRRKGWRTPATAMVISILSFSSYLTIKQNDYWKDPIVFYQRTLQYAPGSPKVLNDLANAYSASHKQREAIALYKKSNPVLRRPIITWGFYISTMARKSKQPPCLKKP